jgi:hypothetical protein
MKTLFITFSNFKLLKMEFSFYKIILTRKLQIPSIIIIILTILFGCKKEILSPSNDLIGTWQLIAVKGEGYDESIPGDYKWYISKNISSKDSIISISTFSYDLRLNPEYGWYGDTIITENKYLFNVKMDINMDSTVYINEDYVKLTDDSRIIRTYNTYLELFEDTVGNNNIKFRLSNIDASGIYSIIFHRSIFTISMDKYKENGTLEISGGIVFSLHGNGEINYIFKKTNYK